ncbi:MAG: hypothetical protein FJ020_05845 [Chloroflexi bacterium]|nr:hypothetical protein [Chloroflexota bacterium]
MHDRFSLSVYVQHKESMYQHEASQRRLLRHLRELEGAAGPKPSLWARLRYVVSRLTESRDTKGLMNRGLIRIAEDRETGCFVVAAGRGTERHWGLLDLPQVQWSVACRKEEVRGAVDELLEQKILAD